MSSHHNVSERLVEVANGAMASHTLFEGDPKSPPLLLLHGAAPGAHAGSNWYSVMPDLARSCYVTAPDLTGFGRTPLPDPLLTHIMGLIGHRVDQVLGLMDSLRIKKADVVGNSMGGALTLQLMLEATERFREVALMGSIGAPAPRTPEMAKLTSFYSDPPRPVIASSFGASLTTRSRSRALTRSSSHQGPLRDCDAAGTPSDRSRHV